MSKIKYLVLALVAVSVFACEERCSIDKPKNLQPIDWEGWNDVHTVYWNMSSECNVQNNPTVNENTKIKISGYIHFNGIYPNGHYDIPSLSDSNCSLPIRWDKEMEKSILTMLTTADITKKCYITGVILGFSRSDNVCCWISPELIIDSVDDIYFEE